MTADPTGSHDWLVLEMNPVELVDELLADVNEDGKVKLDDLLAIHRGIYADLPMNTVGIDALDINSDGQLNHDDLEAAFEDYGRQTTIVEMPWDGDQVQVVRDEWIAQLTDTAIAELASPQVAVSVLAKQGIQVVGGLGQPGLLQVRATQQAALNNSDLFRTVVPNFVIGTSEISTSDFSNDPLSNDLWAFNNTGQTGGVTDADIDLPEAWTVSQGDSNQVIAVIDTGIDASHPDLQSNIWTNQGEIPGNGVDDDGNGFIDDVNGYNFAYNIGNTFDDEGHGTHVAGTIAATSNNSIGVAGVAPNTQLMAVKFLDSQGRGSIAGAIQSISYVTMMKQRGVPIVATNNSWGGGAFSSELRNAIASSGNEGITFVAAAGNENMDNDAAPQFPASYDLTNIISLAASTDQDLPASFSNWGRTTVDVYAPGDSILSTIPNGGYGYKSGTSMATPQVAGQVALLAAVQPDASPEFYKSIIVGTVDPIDQRGRRTDAGGRINVARSLGLETDPDPAPDSPSLSVTATRRRQIDLVWQNNGQDVESFRVFVSTDNQRWTRAGVLPATARSYTIRGLDSDTQYFVRVNARGPGGFARSNVVRTRTDSVSAPDRPNVSVTATRRRQIDLVWQNNGEDVESFRVFVSTDNQRWTRVGVLPASARSYTIRGLDSDTRYFVRVNARGPGGFTRSNVVSTRTTSAAVPNAPTLSVSAVRRRQVDLAWQSNGRNVESFHVFVSLDNVHWTRMAATAASERSFTVRGLNRHTQYFVRVNARGFDGFARSNVLMVTTR